jgi:hypothetical protein
MGVALHIAVLMMPTVRGHPEEQWSLDRHGSGNAKQSADESGAGETAVGEEAVIAPSDTKPSDQIHDHKEDDIQRAEDLVPRQRSGRHETDPRH